MIRAVMNAEVSTSPSFNDPPYDPFIYMILGCKYPQRDRTLTLPPLLIDLSTDHWRQFGIWVHIPRAQALSPSFYSKAGTTLGSKRNFIITYQCRNRSKYMCINHKRHAICFMSFMAYMCNK